MIDLETRARALNEQVVVPAPSVETVLARARRIRTRRRLATLAAIGTSTCVAVGVVALRPSNARVENRIIVGHDAPTSTTFVRPTSVAPPKEFVVQSVVDSPMATSLGSRIDVLETATGRSTLSFEADGFTTGRVALDHQLGLVLWTRLDAAGSTTELMQAPITGGDPRMIASYHGSANGPAGPEWPLFEGVSPDGTQLWMHGDTIRNLANLSEVTTELPPSPSQELGTGVSWLADSHRLFVVEFTDPPGPCDQKDIVRVGDTHPGCALVKSRRRKRAFVFDLRDAKAGWREMPQAAVPTGWSELQLLGPGRLPSTVVAVAQPKAISATSRPHVLTVDVLTGAIVDDTAIPGDSVLAVDGSGTNILFRTAEHLERLSLADTRPVVVGPVVQDAAW